MLAIVLPVFLIVVIALLGFSIAIAYQQVVQFQPFLTSPVWVEVIELAAQILWASIAEHAIGPLVLVLAMPLSFALIPVTLAGARVRRIHIVRIWLYSLIAPGLISFAWLATQAVLFALDEEAVAFLINPWAWCETLPLADYGYLRFTIPGFGLIALLTAWQLMWWTSACRNYLRLPGSGRIVLTLAFASLLAAVAAQLWGVLVAMPY